MQSRRIALHLQWTITSEATCFSISYFPNWVYPIPEIENCKIAMVSQLLREIKHAMRTKTTSSEEWNRPTRDNNGRWRLQPRPIVFTTRCPINYFHESLTKVFPAISSWSPISTLPTNAEEFFDSLTTSRTVCTFLALIIDRYAAREMRKVWRRFSNTKTTFRRCRYFKVWMRPAADFHGMTLNSWNREIVKIESDWI